MSYFPCDIPFMSEDEKKKNGIKCNSDVDKDTNVPSTDTISRQDAIDVAREELESGTYYDIPSKIESLPPAEPEIIRCKDCRWFGDEGCAILIVDDSDKPKEDDFCSFAEKENR